jgi:DNA repair exonuclease SbcCD ATPase subunit
LRLKDEIDKIKGETETKIAALDAQKKKIEQEKADLERKKNAEINSVKAENNDLVKKLQGIERNVELLGRELEKFDKLKKAVGEICEAHHLKTPLRKLKAYKRMIDLYWEIV